VWRVLGTILLLLLVSGCRSDGGVRPPTARERAAISAGAIRELQPFLHSRHLHPRVDRIAVSHRDPHFAYVEVKPLNAAGQQVSETADIVLVQAAGEWIALLDGSDLASVCLHPAPRPIIDLLCH
jgi:hypothetical protein